MDKPTKVLLGGVLVGTLTYGLGQINTHCLERKVQDLHRACVAERDAEAKKGAFSALANIFAGRALCDPIELAKSGEREGIQGQLAAAERELLQWADWPAIACVAILLTCSLPWLWHFLLRRIRELREAIHGN